MDNNNDLYDETTGASEADHVDKAKLQREWVAELKASEKELSKWHEKAEKVLKVYMADQTYSNSGSYQKRFNLFHSNVGVLQSALFARIPKPEVSRRHKDANDQVARVACSILERALVTELETDGYFTETMKNVLKDRLVPGLGAAWVRYLPSLGSEPVQISDDLNAELAEEAGASPIITDERTTIEHVSWRDFRYAPCKTWFPCRWVARRVHMTVDELEERFGKEVADDIALSVEANDEQPSTNDDRSGPKNQTSCTYEVWEIWDKTSKQVIFISEDATEALDVLPDPLGLPHFFPTSKPLLGIHTTDNLVPTPDYIFFQDQYEELSVLNARISSLVDSCKLAGVYDNGAGTDLNKLFYAEDAQLIAVDNWAAFAQSGGLKGVIDFLPIDQVASVLLQLRTAFEQTKAQIYELTGISDIIRGQSSQYETLGAQQIKAQYAGLRLQTMQREVAESVSELLNIKAFLMVKFYDPIRLYEKAGQLPAADAAHAREALALLKDELTANTRIEVSVDSLVAENDLQDKRDRAEAITAVSNLLREGLPAAQQFPQLAPMLLQLVSFGVGSFKGARDIEGTIQAELQKMVAQQQQPQQAKPDPAAEAERAQAQREQVRMAAEQQRHQADVQLEAQKLALEREKNERDFALRQQQLQLEAAKLRIEELKLSNEGVDTSEISLPVGDGMASQRITKEEFLSALQSMQQSFLVAVNQLVNTPQPEAQVVLTRDPTTGSLVGTIQ